MSIETSWPLALPAHHWITMVSLLWGERTDLDRRAETLLTGTTGGTKRWQSGERAFSGRCLYLGASECLSLSLLLPPGAACASLTSLAGCWRERDGCSGICLERVAPLRLVVSSLESNQSNARGEHRPFQIVSLLRSLLEKKCSAQVGPWRVTPKEEMQDSPSQSRGRCKCTRPACIDWRGWAISAKGRVT